LVRSPDEYLILFVGAARYNTGIGWIELAHEVTTIKIINIIIYRQPQMKYTRASSPPSSSSCSVYLGIVRLIPQLNDNVSVAARFAPIATQDIIFF
jgi:hypothetical protein